jgi:hypothetical protein
MTDDTKQWCVLIPCSHTETWAVPQNCLAEIMTLNVDTALPPDEVRWRGRAVPVLDFGSDDGSLWREPNRGTGLVAIFLGLRDEGCEYWGVAVRGAGLKVVSLSPEKVENMPERASPHAMAAFNFEGVLCQVPDLDSFQKKIAITQQVA